MSLESNGKRMTIISLMLPLLMQNIFTVLYGSANTVLLSGFSESAVTASSVANQVMDLSVVLINMITSGTVILSSIELGASDRKRAAHYAGTGVITVAVASVVLGIANLFLGEIFLSAMNLEGETLRLASKYYTVRAIFLPIVALMNFFNNLLICNGFSKYTFVVGVSGNLLNFLLSWVALYSGLDFMDPISRVALAAGIAQVLSLISSILIFRRCKCPFAFEYKASSMLKTLKLGIPGAMVSFMFRIAQTVTTGFVALMGDDVINTKVYIANIVGYVPLIGGALSSANTVFMGRYKGAGQLEKSKTLYRQNLCIALCCNLVLSLAAFAFHRPLMRLFTSDEEIIAASGIIFFADLFVQMPRAVNNISEGSLSANGDVKIPFITSTVSCWACSVALSYVLCVLCNMGILGLWIAFAADETFKATVYLFRWRSGKWKNVNL